MNRTRLSAATAAAAALLVTACGAETDEGPRTTVGPDGQMTWDPADAAVPTGYHEELCPDLRQRGSGLALRLVVPDGYDAESGRSGAGCSFVADLDRDFSVSLGSEQSLRTFKEKSVDPDDGGEGDDGTSNIEYSPDQQVFGDRRGEVVTWDSNNDGLPLDNQIVQADGVRLAWYTPQGKAEKWAEELDTVMSSVSVVESNQATCRRGQTTAFYEPPVPQTESIDSYGQSCLLYFRPRDSLLRRGEIAIDPRVSVDELATRLEARKSVVSVTLEPGAAMLAGDPADRLTWVVDQPRGDFQPGGTWRLVTLASDDLQVTWGATPEQWQEEQDDYRRFVGSVRLESR